MTIGVLSRRRRVEMARCSRASPAADPNSDVTMTGQSVAGALRSESAINVFTTQLP